MLSTMHRIIILLKAHVCHRFERLCPNSALKHGDCHQVGAFSQRKVCSTTIETTTHLFDDHFSLATRVRSIKNRSFDVKFFIMHFDCSPGDSIYMCNKHFLKAGATHKWDPIVDGTFLIIHVGGYAVSVHLPTALRNEKYLAHYWGNLRPKTSVVPYIFTWGD